jgi:hypothetical protein
LAIAAEWIFKFMAEWITLLLVAPAILLPVALLVGFAACFKKPDPPQPPPTIDSAMGKDPVTITVVWETGSGWQSFELKRTGPNGADPPFPVSVSPFDDPGRDPATEYSYQVRGFNGSGDATDFSEPPVPATTPSVVSTYSKTLTDSSAGWEGFTLVQRIEAAHLSAAGQHVRITVQASPTSDASIDRVYISQAAATGKPYDSAGNLTAVYGLAADQQQPFVVSAGTTKSLPIVAYTLNQFQALIIAIDFSTAPGSGIASATVPASEASAYYYHYQVTPPLPPEAAMPIRTPNYSGGVDAMGNSFVLLITNVEVG